MKNIPTPELFLGYSFLLLAYPIIAIPQWMVVHGYLRSPSPIALSIGFSGITFLCLLYFTIFEGLLFFSKDLECPMEWVTFRHFGEALDSTSFLYGFFIVAIIITQWQNSILGVSLILLGGSNFRSYRTLYEISKKAEDARRVTLS